jgi:hypothetical protein
MTTTLRLILTLAAAALFTALAFAAVTPQQARAHSHPCHRAHACPSDHATYRWLGRIGGVRARWLCVKRRSSKYNRTFNRRVRYGGRLYYCKR